MMEEINWTTFLVGTALALFGWTIYWMGVHVIGTFLGAAIGLGGGILIVNLFELTDDAALIAVAAGGLVFGVLGFMLMRMVQNYFFFLVGAFLGAPGCYKLITTEPLSQYAWTQTSVAAPVAIILGALVGGFVVLGFRKYIIAIVSAVLGSWLMVMSLSVDNPVLVGGSIFVFSTAMQTGMLRNVLAREKAQKEKKKLKSNRRE